MSFIFSAMNSVIAAGIVQPSVYGIGGIPCRALQAFVSRSAAAFSSSV